MGNTKRRTCYYCACTLSDNQDNLKRRTVDHKIPKSRGGSGRHNKVAACYECNFEKSDLTAEEYLQWITAGRPEDKDSFKCTTTFGLLNGSRMIYV